MGHTSDTPKGSITLNQKGTFCTSANFGVWTAPELPRLHIFAPNAAHVPGEESMWGGASLLSFSADPERAKVDKSAREGPPGMARRVPSIFQAQLGRVSALQSSLENSSAGFLE